MLTQLTKKPGEFKAFCRMPRWVDVAEVFADSSVDSEAYSGRWNRKLERSEMLVPCAFETTDRAAFEAHAALHAEDRGERRHLVKLKRPVMSVPVRMWKTPPGADEARPIVDRDKVLQTCSTCGLVGQVDGNAGELWWDEHERGCALAQSGAAS